MSDTTWKRLEVLFHEATTRPPAERVAYAYATAGDEPTLLRDLLSMIAADQDATRMLEAPLRGVAVPELEAGHRLGPWAIERLIGTGGMGRVYLGHRADGAYERAVAIKLIASGLVDATQAMLFELECRALARMRHPAIAEIHDAGRDAEGHHYLVMEYIDGLPVTQWCDRHRLPLRERVALFVRICEGVQHAHQKGVLHRDLKPANVLVGMVDGRPAPKLIDFGIAIEAAGGAGTDAGGTPGYMSPEQAALDGDVDVRSDIYSLGALLYELACGSRPDGAVVADAQSPRPSRRPQALEPAERADLAALRGSTPRRVERALRDGIDAIVRCALERDRSLRYGSVSMLLDDLRRWLEGRPPAVARGRALAASLFLRRNRFAVAAGGALALALAVGMVATVWALGEAQRESARARAVAGFLGSILKGVDPSVARGLDQTLMLRVLDDAAERAERELAAQPETLADVEMTIAQSLHAMGRFERALEHATRVERLGERHPQALAGQRLDAIRTRGMALSNLGRAAEAIEAFDRGADVAAAALPQHRWRVHDFRANSAWFRYTKGDFAGALEMAEDAYAGLVAQPSADRYAVLDAALRLGSILGDARQFERAAPLIEDAVARATEIHGPEDPITLEARRDLAVIRLRGGEYAQVEPELREQIAIHRRIHGEDSGWVAEVGGMLASSLRNQGKIAEAGPYYRATLEWNSGHYGEDSINALSARHNHANWLLSDGQAQAARDEQAAVLSIGRDALGSAHQLRIAALRGRAEAEVELGLLDAARRSAEAAMAAAMQRFGADEAAALAPARETMGIVEAAERAAAAPGAGSRDAAH